MSPIDRIQQFLIDAGYEPGEPSLPSGPPPLPPEAYLQIVNAPARSGASPDGERGVFSAPAVGRDAFVAAAQAANGDTPIAVHIDRRYYSSARIKSIVAWLERELDRVDPLERPALKVV